MYALPLSEGLNKVLWWEAFIENTFLGPTNLCKNFLTK